MRFKVKKALYPHGTNNDSWQPMNLIVDDDIPCTEINRHLEKSSHVSGIFRQLFSIMFNDLDIYIESIASLTSSDVKILQVPSFKYSRLLDEPNTRIIPGYGICRNENCKPQFSG